MPKVQLVTNYGIIVLELNSDKAPKTTTNFVKYVNSGFYNNTLFHRVTSGFAIQGGMFQTSMQPRPTGASIQNEADNGLKNTKYSIGMSRSAAPHSATVGFYINLADNESFNHRDQSDAGWGYCVFGEVVQGRETVDMIGSVPTESKPPYTDKPTNDVIIQSAKVIG